MTQMGELAVDDRRGIGHRARRRRLPLAPVVARRTGRAHRGRLGRSDEEHHRRARARTPRRTARRQGRPVEGRACAKRSNASPTDIVPGRDDERADPEVAGALAVDRAQHVEVTVDAAGLWSRVTITQRSICLLHVELDVADAHRATRPASSSPSPSSSDVGAEAATVPVPDRRRGRRARRVSASSRGTGPADRPTGTTRRCPRARSRARSRSDR